MKMFRYGHLLSQPLLFRNFQFHCGSENLKKSRPKKLMKSNKSISRLFLTKIHFLPFQKWPKINIWTGKKFKTAKYAISRKKFFDNIWFHEFFWLDFFKFSGPLCSSQQEFLHLKKLTTTPIPQLLQLLMNYYIEQTTHHIPYDTQSTSSFIM